MSMCIESYLAAADHTLHALHIDPYAIAFLEAVYNLIGYASENYLDSIPTRAELQVIAICPILQLCGQHNQDVVRW